MEKLLGRMDGGAAPPPQHSLLVEGGQQSGVQDVLLRLPAVVSETDGSQNSDETKRRG